MNRLLFFIAALLAVLPASSPAFAADGTFDKTVNVSGAATVSVATGSGYVHVSSGSGSQVHIVGHVHAQRGWLSGDSDARVKRIVDNPPITQSGNTVTVGDNHGDNTLFQNISIDYDVVTPRASTLKARSGSGELQIANIDGAVDAGSGSGDVKVDGIGANSRLETGSGSIRATNVHGAANLQTGSGDLQLGLTAAGDVRAQTGSGSIHIDGLNGGLRAGNGSGDIEVSGNPTSEWRLESGSGGIRVKLAANARFNLNAETGSGTVRVDQPILMQGALNKHHVSGTVNGGGPTVRATTGSGDITIH